MTKEYKYRPPYTYLLTGLGGLLMAFIFGSAIVHDKFWFSIVVGFFGLLTLIIGVIFLTIFLGNITIKNVVIGPDFIEIPIDKNKRIRLPFSEIENWGELDSFHHIIALQFQAETYVIERQWMKKSDFEKLRLELKNKNVANE